MFRCECAFVAALGTAALLGLAQSACADGAVITGTRQNDWGNGIAVVARNDLDYAWSGQGVLLLSDGGTYLFDIGTGNMVGDMVFLAGGGRGPDNGGAIVIWADPTTGYWFSQFNYRWTPSGYTSEWAEGIADVRFLP